MGLWCLSSQWIQHLVLMSFPGYMFQNISYELSLCWASYILILRINVEYNLQKNQLRSVVKYKCLFQNIRLQVEKYFIWQKKKIFHILMRSIDNHLTYYFNSWKCYYLLLEHSYRIKIQPRMLSKKCIFRIKVQFI